MEIEFDVVAEVAHLASTARVLDSSTAIDELQRVERCLSHLHAVRTDLLVSAGGYDAAVDEVTVTDPRPDHHGQRTLRIEDAIREEIAAALRWTPNVAGNLLHEARVLHSHLPLTLQSLRLGEISERHARDIAETAMTLSSSRPTTDEEREAFSVACLALEERVVPIARRATVSNTRAACRRALRSLDAAGARKRRQRARCTRDVQLIEEGDGITSVLARMSTPAAHSLMAAVRRRASTIDDAQLSAGEKRAQALMALVFGDTAPHVRLNVVLPTSASELDLPDLIPTDLDGTVDGVEIEGESLRELLADPAVGVTLRKLLVDDVTGQLTACGRTTYQVPDRLRDFITLRDGTCRFPGCRRRADLCQIDHADAWDDGGMTDSANLGALCTRHHQLKTHAGWEILASTGDGQCEWRSPQGRRYRHDPEPVQDCGASVHHRGEAPQSPGEQGHPPGQHVHPREEPVISGNRVTSGERVTRRKRDIAGIEVPTIEVAWARALATVDAPAPSSVFIDTRTNAPPPF